MQNNNTKSLDKISLGISILAFIVSLGSFYVSNKSNEYSKIANIIAQQQVDISEQQTDISQKQTDILDIQTQIQQDSLEFEKNKNWTDTTKEYRKIMSDFFDKLQDPNNILSQVHEKVIKGDEVTLKNLDIYVNNWEDIGNLFCDGKIKLSDLRFILKNTIEPLCGNSQIYNHYQNTKSGISGMCKKMFPQSNVMARHISYQKCQILNNK